MKKPRIYWRDGFWHCESLDPRGWHNGGHGTTAVQAYAFWASIFAALRAL